MECRQVSREGCMMEVVSFSKGRQPAHGNATEGSCLLLGLLPWLMPARHHRARQPTRLSLSGHRSASRGSNRRLSAFCNPITEGWKPPIQFTPSSAQSDHFYFWTPHFFHICPQSQSWIKALTQCQKPDAKDRHLYELMIYDLSYALKHSPARLSSIFSLPPLLAPTFGAPGGHRPCLTHLWSPKLQYLEYKHGHWAVYKLWRHKAQRAPSPSFAPMLPIPQSSGP